MNININTSTTNIIDTRILKTEYKNYDLLSRFWNGQYRGRAWKNGKKVADYEGTNIDMIIESLMQIVDQLREKKLAKRQGAAITQDEHVKAWLEVLPKCSASAISALSLNARSKDKTTTVERLMKLAAYETGSQLVGDYKQIAQRLAVELLLDLGPQSESTVNLFNVTPEDVDTPLRLKSIILNPPWAESYQLAQKDKDQQDDEEALLENY